MNAVEAQCARVILRYVQWLQEAPDSPHRLARELMEIEGEMYSVGSKAKDLGHRVRKAYVAFNPGAVAAVGILAEVGTPHDPPLGWDDQLHRWV